MKCKNYLLSLLENIPLLYEDVQRINITVVIIIIVIRTLVKNDGDPLKDLLPDSMGSPLLNKGISTFPERGPYFNSNFFLNFLEKIEFLKNKFFQFFERKSVLYL
jgi:hypothetical protein